MSCLLSFLSTQITASVKIFLTNDSCLSFFAWHVKSEGGDRPLLNHHFHCWHEFALTKLLSDVPVCTFKKQISIIFSFIIYID